MITINNDVSPQQVTETFPKAALYCTSNEYDETLKVEMTPLQDTTILGDSTVVTITPDQPLLRDHIIWSMLNTFYMNFCCLGLIAFVFSVKSRDQKLIGNRSRAKYYGSTARSLNISSTVLTMLVYLISMAIIYVNFVYLAAAARNWFGI